MALNKNTLQQAIKAALEASGEAARQEPPPEPDTLLDDLARDLANAIDTFVRGAEVTGVTTSVSVDGALEGQPISSTGTGTQNNTGQLQ